MGGWVRSTKLFDTSWGVQPIISPSIGETRNIQNHHQEPLVSESPTQAEVSMTAAVPGQFVSSADFCAEKIMNVGRSLLWVLGSSKNHCMWKIYHGYISTWSMCLIFGPQGRIKNIKNKNSWSIWELECKDVSQAFLTGDAGEKSESRTGPSRSCGS